MIKSQVLLFTSLIMLAACQLNTGNKNEQKEAKSEAQKDQGQKKQSNEHNAGTGVDVSDIETGIRSHIREKTKKGNGYFHVQHDSQKLSLKLVRVHTEYISNLGPQRHFACVDLAAKNGNVYDVDFFLEGKAGEMNVTQTTVHKRNGRPFYTWEQQEDNTWHRVPVENASPELMGVKKGTDTFEFHYKAEIPELKQKAEMWVPVATSDSFQTVKITKLQVPGKKQKIQDKEYGNTILHLQLNPKHSGKTIKIEYQVRRMEKEPYKANKPVQNRNAFSEQYTASTELLPTGGRFEKIAEKAIDEDQKDNKLVQARALYDYILENVKYKKAGKYGTGDATYACNAETGNCTEFHSYFISLARSVNIPARFAIGAGIPSSRDKGGISGYHCWVEFYAEGKWWPADISEGNKYSDLSTYYFGHHPANRITLSKGRNLEVEPGPDSGPIKFLAYPVLETAEGEKVDVETTFSFKRYGKGA